MKTLPPCPKCGKAPDLISERPLSVSEAFFVQNPTAAKQVICVYRCSCGTTFTQTEKADNEK